jgi:DNA ligase-1
MPDLADGESTQVQGSGSSVYTIRNIGGVYSCSCPAWRNQSNAIETRTCKHIRKLRGDAAEEARTGGAIPVPARAKKSDDEDETPAKESPLLLAEAWDGAVDVTGWWMSEKLDGVRAFWDGKQFISRLGNVFAAPEWFTAGLPSVALDGELWLERRQFQRTVSVVRRKDQSEHWRQIRYLVFDAPLVDEPFEARMDQLRELIAEHRPEFAATHEHARCRGISHLKEELERIQTLGGEGLMLREPASRYVAGRSSTLLKVKTFHDAEAHVIGHQKGAGRHKGRLGALLVRLADGTEFSVGTGFSDAERESPPPVGSTITFRYQELSDGGVPRFPSYVGVRRDEPVKAERRTRVKADDEAPMTSVTVDVPAPRASSELSESTKRYFTFRDEKSDKFWEITTDQLAVTVRFGRAGTQGHSQTKSFADQSAAKKHADSLVSEKVKKGYVEST